MEEVGMSVEVHTIQSTESPLDTQISCSTESPLDTQISCSICGKVFNDYSNCRKHSLRHGQNKGNECEICHHLFQGKQQKLQHIMFEHGEERYEFKCQICGEVFHILEDLHKHSSKEHNTGEQCSICFETYLCKEALKLHMVSHVDNNSAFKCETCGKFYRDKFSYRTHMRNHTGERPFECPHCPERFTARMYLFRHLESKHMSETPYHCELCHVSFKTIIQLRSHVKTKMHIKHQNNDYHDLDKEVVPRNFTCPHCLKSFAQQTYLTIHLRIHSGVKPYYCPICSRGFAQVGNMNQHIRRKHQPKIPGGIHKDKALTCSHCEQTFNCRRSYNFHVRSHATQKDFICSICQKSFTGKSKLRLHEETHDPNSMIKCNTCKKVFFSWSNLKRHYKVCWAYQNKRGDEIDSPVSIIKEEIIEEVEQAKTDETNHEINDVELNETVCSIIKMEPGWEQECQDTNFKTNGGYSIIKLQPMNTDFPDKMNESPNVPDNIIDSTCNDLSSNGTPLTSYQDSTIKQEILDVDDIEESCYPLEIDELQTTANDNNATITMNSYRFVSSSYEVPVEHQPIMASQTQSELTTAMQSVLSKQNTIPISIQTNLSTENGLNSEAEVMELLSSKIISEVPEFIAEEMVDAKEIIPQINPLNSTGRNSQVVIYKMDDKIVEVEYIYPDHVAEEEVITSQTDLCQTSNMEIEEEETIKNVSETADIIASLVDQSAQIVPIQSSTEYAEISDYDQTNGADQGILSRNYEPRLRKSYNRRTNVSDHDQCACSICGKEFADKANLRHHEKRHGNNKANECSICKKLFQGRQQVFQHKMFDHGIKPSLINCEICNLELTTIVDLRRHCDLFHSEEYPFECSFCFKRYQDKQTYEFHLTFHERAFKCDKCEKSYDSQKTLGLHYRSHTGERPHQCDVCLQKFFLLSHLRAHTLTHLEDKPFKCPVCYKGFTKNQKMKYHLETHGREKTRKKRTQTLSEKTYHCAVCPKAFSQQTYLTVHMRTHTGNHPYSCPICGKTFAQSGNMLKHVKSHKVKKVTDWIHCSQCERIFRSEADLKRHHDAQHGPDMSLECDVCSKMFSTKYKLSNHMTTHAEVQYIQCEICDATLKSNDSYRKHMMYHNAPSVRCPICDVSLTNKRLLKKHFQDYHNRDNIFECKNCHRRYPNEDKLNFHMKCHRDKPFKCPICDRCYLIESSLHEHTLTHSKEKEHQCQFCFKKFMNQKTLSRHLKIHTGNDSEIIQQLISDEPDELRVRTKSYLRSKAPVKIVISEDFFKCVDCQEKFSHKEEFLQHVKTHTLVNY